MTICRALSLHLFSHKSNSELSYQQMINTFYNCCNFANTNSSCVSATIKSNFYFILPGGTECTTHCNITFWIPLANKKCNANRQKLLIFMFYTHFSDNSIYTPTCMLDVRDSTNSFTCINSTQPRRVWSRQCSQWCLPQDPADLVLDTYFRVSWAALQPLYSNYPREISTEHSGSLDSWGLLCRFLNTDGCVQPLSVTEDWFYS